MAENSCPIDVWDSIPWRGFDHPVIVAPEECFTEALRKALDILAKSIADRVSVGDFALGGYFEGVHLEKSGKTLVISYEVAAKGDYRGYAKGPVKVGDVEIEPEYNDAVNAWMVYAIREERLDFPRSREDVEKIVEHIAEEAEKLQNLADEHVEDVIAVSEEELPP